MAEITTEFKIGDTVALKAGGPAMVITSAPWDSGVNGDMVEVAIPSASDVVTSGFPVATLAKIKQQAVSNGGGPYDIFWAFEANNLPINCDIKFNPEIVAQDAPQV